jgi:hypothetical protein
VYAALCWVLHPEETIVTSHAPPSYAKVHAPLHRNLHDPWEGEGQSTTLGFLEQETLHLACSTAPLIASARRWAPMSSER